MQQEKLAEAVKTKLLLWIRTSIKLQFCNLRGHYQDSPRIFNCHVQTARIIHECCPFNATSQSVCRISVDEFSAEPRIGLWISDWWRQCLKEDWSFLASSKTHSGPKTELKHFKSHRSLSLFVVVKTSGLVGPILEQQQLTDVGLLCECMRNNPPFCLLISCFPTVWACRLIKAETFSCKETGFSCMNPSGEFTDVFSSTCCQSSGSKDKCH